MTFLKKSQKNFRIKNKIIVILGPTASGKSALGVKLAQKINGEIISADSRQVYKGLNMASGKITKKEMMGVPHHCLDLVSPKTTFTALNYKKCAQKAIKDILERGKTPLIVGGTGFYIDAALGLNKIPEVPPNWPQRSRLEQKSAKELLKMLRKLDPNRVKTVEPKNKRRIIRAIEIAKFMRSRRNKNKNRLVSYMIPVNNNILWLGIKTKPEELKRKINSRIDASYKGMVREIKKLHSDGVSWKRLEELGLWPKLIAQRLQNKMPKDETVEKLKIFTWRYSRRQMTWFRRNKKIHWIPLKVDLLKLF